MGEVRLISQHRNYRGYQPQAQQLRINNQIRVPQVRLIMPDGDNKGVIDTREAIDMARNLRLDLIEVAPNAAPPVCRIMDYGKYTYEREKKERAAKRSQKSIDIKGIQLRPKTTEHHLHFKIRSARRFLMQGNKVKANLKFRGRENTHLEVARRMLYKIVDGCQDLAYIEVAPNVEGKGMLLILAPNKETIEKAHLAATQTHVEVERAKDKAEGYDEEVEDAEDDTDDEGEEIIVDEYAQKLEAKKLANREKRAKKLADEQLGLP